MLSAKTALSHWILPQSLQTSSEQGLINQTWIVGSPPKGVLQWVNPIFDPTIHLDLEVITQHLEHKGFPTPRLQRTKSDELFLRDPDGGSWRIWSFLPGQTFHKMTSTKLAHSAGACVGKFVGGW